MKSFTFCSSVCLGLGLLSLQREARVTSLVIPSRVVSTRSSLLPSGTSAATSAGSPNGHQWKTSTQNIQSSTTTATTSLDALPTALSSLAALPLSQKILLSCFLPTCLGFWKNEYGVSYAYGTATALTAYWIANAYTTTAACSMSYWPLWHAGALMFYGIRLCAFLAYREIFSQRMKESVQRIEQKARERGPRWKRAPFVVACAGLYFGLCAPLLVTSPIMASTTTTATTTKAAAKAAAALSSSWLIPQPWMSRICQSLVGLTWFGFVLAALGDLNKSVVKAIKGNEDHLVTGGIYKFCRHPNYTGEVIGWTCNGFLALFAAIATKGAAGIIPLPQLMGYLAASLAGALGLDFVLFGATRGLEKRQKEKYGDTEEYQQWVDSTWAGFQMPENVEKVADEVSSVTPEIEPIVDVEEKGGTGI